MAVITEAPIVVGDVLAVLDDASSGAVAVFVGRVRDRDQGRVVCALGYQAHPSALDRLEEVCARVGDAHDARVAAVHRVGDLVVGDIAVVVAAATGHRGGGFDACRDLIDTLKAEVPIWKHQRFADGSEQWVGTP